MAYPSVSRPYGLVPVTLIGGEVFAGSTRMYPIASTAGNMFSGDMVQLSATGSLVPSTMTSAVAITSNVPSATQAIVPGTVGVFLGAEYSTAGGPLFGKMRNSYWSTALSTAQDAVGYVIDNPDAIFKSAVLGQTLSTTTSSNTTTTVGYMSPAFVGSNVYYVGGNGGSLTTGNSLAGVSGFAPQAGTAGSTGNLRIPSSATLLGAFRVVGLVPETAVTVSTTISTATNTNAVTVASAAGVQPGMQAIVTNPNGTTTAASPSANFVVASVSGNVVTLGAGQTVNTLVGSVVTFIGYPEVLVKINQTYHSYYNGQSV
jgi:hypothetical protein